MHFSKVHITEATLQQLHNEFSVSENAEGGDDFIKQCNIKTYFIDDSEVNIYKTAMLFPLNKNCNPSDLKFQ